MKPQYQIIIPNRSFCMSVCSVQWMDKGRECCIVLCFMLYFCWCCKQAEDVRWERNRGEKAHLHVFGHIPLLLQLKIISGLTPCCKKSCPIHSIFCYVCVCSPDSHLCVGDKWVKEVIDHKTQQIHCYCGTTGHIVLMLKLHIEWGNI